MEVIHHTPGKTLPGTPPVSFLKRVQVEKRQNHLFIRFCSDWVQRLHVTANYATSHLLGQEVASMRRKLEAQIDRKPSRVLPKLEHVTSNQPYLCACGHQNRNAAIGVPSTISFVGTARSFGCPSTKTVATRYRIRLEERTAGAWDDPRGLAAVRDSPTRREWFGERGLQRKWLHIFSKICLEHLTHSRCHSDLPASPGRCSASFLRKMPSATQKKPCSDFLLRLASSRARTRIIVFVQP